MNAALFQLQPGGLVATQGAALYPHEGVSGQISQGTDLWVIGAREYHPAEAGVGLALTAIAQGGDTADAIANLQLDIEGGIGEDKIHPVAGHGGEDLFEVEGNDLEMVAGNRLGEVVGGGLPLGVGQLMAPFGQYADAHVLCGQGQVAPEKRQPQQTDPEADAAMLHGLSGPYAHIFSRLAWVNPKLNGGL